MSRKCCPLYGWLDVKHSPPGRSLTRPPYRRCSWKSPYHCCRPSDLLTLRHSPGSQIGRPSDSSEHRCRASCPPFGRLYLLTSHQKAKKPYPQNPRHLHTPHLAQDPHLLHSSHLAKPQTLPPTPQDRGAPTSPPSPSNATPPPQTDSQSPGSAPVSSHPSPPPFRPPRPAPSAPPSRPTP